VILMCLPSDWHGPQEQIALGRVKRLPRTDLRAGQRQGQRQSQRAIATSSSFRHLLRALLHLSIDRRTSRANSVQSGSNGGLLEAAHNTRKMPPGHCLDDVRAEPRFRLALLHADGGKATVQVDAYRTDRSRTCHGLQLEGGTLVPSASF